MRKEFVLRTLEDMGDFIVQNIKKEGFFSWFIIFNLYRWKFFFEPKKHYPPQEPRFSWLNLFIDRENLKVHESHEGLFYFYYSEYKGTLIKVYLTANEVEKHESRSYWIEKYKPRQLPQESDFIR